MKGKRKRSNRSSSQNSNRKKSDNLIQVERDKLKLIIKSIGQGMTVVNTDYSIEFMNDFLVERFGDCVGQLCYQVYMGLSQPCDLCPMRKAVETGQVQEVELTAADGRDYELISAPFTDVDGKVKVAEVVRDITERKRTEKATESARRFAEDIIATVREPLVVLDKELRVVSANRSFYKTFQVGPDETEGRFIFDLGNRQWDIPELRRLLEEILPFNTSFEDFQIEHDFESIGRRVMSLNARGIEREKDETQFILLAIEDITERKRAEERVQHLQRVLMAIQNLDRLITQEKDWKKLLKKACEILIQSRNYRLAWIGLIEEGSKNVLPVAQAGFEKGYLESVKVTWDDSEPGKSPAGIAIKTKKPFVIRNIHRNPLFKPLRAEAQKRGYASLAAIPLIHEKRIFGVLNIYADIPNAFDKEEIDLLTEVSGDLAFALEAIELESERKRLEDALRESEQRYRTIFENTGTAIAIVEEDTTLSLVNTEFEKLSGYSREEIEGKICWTEFVAKDDLEKMKEYHRLRRINPKAAPRNYEFKFIDRNGQVKDIFLTVGMIPGTKKSVTSLLDITAHKRAEEELKQSFGKLQRTLEGTVHAMALAVEMKDPYTAGHQRRVSNLACAIAKEMGLSKDQIEGTNMAGVLHDIGKICVPAEILSKPGPLTEIELSLIKTHSRVGHDILKEIEFPWPIALIVLQHHERMDGSGYPLGLSGENILLEARILGVADVVEAMVSHRPYRPAFGIDKALEEISQNRSILYDSNVVDACLKLFTTKGFKLE